MDAVPDAWTAAVNFWIHIYEVSSFEIIFSSKREAAIFGDYNLQLLMEHRISWTWGILSVSHTHIREAEGKATILSLLFSLKQLHFLFFFLYRWKLKKKSQPYREFRWNREILNVDKNGPGKQNSSCTIFLTQFKTGPWMESSALVTASQQKHISLKSATSRTRQWVSGS